MKARPTNRRCRGYVEAAAASGPIGVELPDRSSWSCQHDVQMRCNGAERRSELSRAAATNPARTLHGRMIHCLGREQQTLHEPGTVERHTVFAAVVRDAACMRWWKRQREERLGAQVRLFARMNASCNKRHRSVSSCNRDALRVVVAGLAGDRSYSTAGRVSHVHSGPLRGALAEAAFNPKPGQEVEVLRGDEWHMAQVELVYTDKILVKFKSPSILAESPGVPSILTESPGVPGSSHTRAPMHGGCGGGDAGSTGIRDEKEKRDGGEQVWIERGSRYLRAAPQSWGVGVGKDQYVEVMHYLQVRSSSKFSMENSEAQHGK